MCVALRQMFGSVIPPRPPQPIRKALRKSIGIAIGNAIAGIIALGAAVAILVLPLLARLPILGWNEISRYLASPGPAVFAVGILTGIVVERWRRTIVRDYTFSRHAKLYWTWLAVIGSLTTMGIGLPYIAMVAGTTGVRSLETAGVHIEFGGATSGGRSPLVFEVERHDVARFRLVHVVSATVEDYGLLSFRLKQDSEFYKKVAEKDLVLRTVDVHDAMRIRGNFEKARAFSEEFLSPTFKCIQEARRRQLDETQTVQHALALAHGLRRVLAAGRTVAKSGNTGAAKSEVNEALNALVAGEQHAWTTFCKLAGRDGEMLKRTDWEPPREEDFAALSEVPHLYTLLAWFYMSADELDTALQILKEGDSDSVAFKSDMNYNITHGYVLYLLKRPAKDSIRFQERALNFANEVVEAVPESWTDGMLSSREFAMRYARAQRQLRQELALLLAHDGKRMGEAVHYARTFFEETGRWERTWRWDMQWGRDSASQQRIRIGRFDDWSRDEIYWLPADAVTSCLVYGYTVMALEARAAVPDPEMLLVARDLFEEGMQMFKEKEVELTTLGQHSTYIRLEANLKQAVRLLKDIEYF